jgi:pimeloyl-ACP methyl ester carboxylesterase/class 3 adenylate cyclase
LFSPRGELVTKEQLLNSVWPETFVGEAVLKTCIGEIRRVLRDESRQPRFIETVHRRGYRFMASLDEQSSDQKGALQEDVRGLQRSDVGARDAPHAVLDTSHVIPETHYARNGEINIAYQVYGNGPLDLILVMGWVSHLEYFWTEPSFARFLRRLGSFARLLLFDKQGTGLSDRVPISRLPTLEERMDDVRAVMEAVGSERAVICGISEGGILSALFSATYPEKTLGLIMIAPYAKRIRSPDYPWGPTLEEREQFYNEILDNWGGPVGLEERAPSVASDPRFREWWATYLRMGASPGAALAITKMNTQIDARHVLVNVRVPTLVLHRKDDRCLLVEEGRFVASLIPGARFVELPGVDHLPFVGDQDSILDEIEQFVLGTRLRPSVDRVLATVLCAQFLELRDGRKQSLSSVSAELRGLLANEIRREIEWFRGRDANVSRQGPLAIFDGPARAVRCACAIAERASWLGLSLSAGLHTGECDCSDAGVSGLAATVASQLAEMAPPGEILASNTVRDLVAGSGIEWDERCWFGYRVGRARYLGVFRSTGWASSVYRAKTPRCIHDGVPSCRTGIVNLFLSSRL